MKTNQNKTLAVVIILAATMAISSCQKEKLTSKVKDSTDPVKVDETFNTIQRTIMFEVTRNLSFKTESCETITDDTISVPHVRTIDYGTGCVDSDGKTRKGQMIITYDTEDFLNVTGANSYTAFNNFFVDDNQITGSFNIHNDGVNGNGNYSYSVVGKYDKIFANGGGMESIIGQQDIEWINGSATPNDASDNEYSYTGSIDGTTVNGETLTLTILQPLIEKHACGIFFVSGVELLHATTQTDRTLDYGDGTCDNLAEETVDGVTQTVTLQ